VCKLSGHFNSDTTIIDTAFTTSLSQTCHWI